jgi:hypothetical protein
MTLDRDGSARRIVPAAARTSGVADSVCPVPCSAGPPHPHRVGRRWASVPEAVRALRSPCVFLATGSGEQLGVGVFGCCAKTNPTDEGLKVGAPLVVAAVRCVRRVGRSRAAAWRGASVSPAWLSFSLWQHPAHLHDMSSWRIVGIVGIGRKAAGARRAAFCAGICEYIRSYTKYGWIYCNL